MGLMLVVHIIFRIICRHGSYNAYLQMQEKSLQEEALEMTARKLSYVPERGSHTNMAKAVDYLKEHRYRRQFFSCFDVQN